MIASDCESVERGWIPVSCRHFNSFKMSIHLHINACYGPVDDGAVFEFESYSLIVQLHQESNELHPGRNFECMVGEVSAVGEQGLNRC